MKIKKFFLQQEEEKFREWETNQNKVQLMN